MTINLLAIYCKAVVPPVILTTSSKGAKVLSPAGTGCYFVIGKTTEKRSFAMHNSTFPGNRRELLGLGLPAPSEKLDNGFFRFQLFEGAIQ